MNLAITTLEHESIQLITDTFNEAFRDYFIPLQLSTEQMEQKFRCEGIQLANSIGAFDGEKLVGFILHGVDVVAGENVIYNGGTGVIPSHRGHGITSKMYSFAVPFLKKQGIKRHLLEVIEGNAPAIRSYEKTGFTSKRTLSAFRGTLDGLPVAGVQVEVMEHIPDTKPFGEMQPTWQNNTAAVLRDRENHEVIGAYVNDELAGYAIFTPANGRVKQFGVKENYRRRKVGTALFQYMMTHSGGPQMLIPNIDNACVAAQLFLKSLGIEKILDLSEMEMQCE